MQQPRRLTLVIHSLEGGGAERTMAMMANHWAGAGRSVTLVTLADQAKDAYRLDKQVQRVALDEMAESQGLATAIRNNWRRIRRMRKAIAESQPDCVIAFTPVINILTRFACGKRYPLIISERVDPRRHRIGKVWERLRRTVYPRCQRLVVQTQDVADAFSTFVPANRLTVIPNAVSPPRRATELDLRDGRTVVAVGRLHPQKGFDLLLEAFAQIADRFPDWRVQIWGEGDERIALERRAEQLGIAARVLLPGWTADIDGPLQTAGLFVLSSRYEGFPNALLEAMKWGAPVVAFDCPSGPREIIRDQVDGVLVADEDVDQLAVAMAELMSDDALRKRLGGRATEVSDRFSEAAFFTAWDEVIRGAANSS